MTTLTTDSTAVTQSTKENSQQMNKLHTVYVRLMFLRIGEIDTLNEKYQAQATVESRWEVDFNQLSSELSSDDQKRLAEGKSVSLVKYTDSHWYPQLYIENAVGDLKEQIRYTAKISSDDDKVYVCEHRDLKGQFWEKLELHHFPSDVQDLSISVASMLYNDKVLLIPDPYHISGINREAFVDQQEWILYAHVDAEQRYVDEFDFQSADQDDEEVEANKGRKRAIITVTCHAARQSQYFYWNGYFLIFAIALVSFCCYFIPPHQVAGRIHTTCTLLLASITFRWTVNRSLPTISYLTSLDIYGILCIVILVVNTIWHAFVGLLAYVFTPNFVVTRGMWLMKLDRLGFLVAFTIFVLGNAGLIIWLFTVPLRLRKKMEQKDAELHLSKSKKTKRLNNNRPVGGNQNDGSNYARIPIE